MIRAAQQSRFAETLTLTLTLNHNFGESGFGESGRHPTVAVATARKWSGTRPGPMLEEGDHSVNVTFFDQTTGQVI